MPKRTCHCSWEVCCLGPGPGCPLPILKAIVWPQKTLRDLSQDRDSERQEDGWLQKGKRPPIGTRKAGIIAKTACRTKLRTFFPTRAQAERQQSAEEKDFGDLVLKPAANARHPGVMWFSHPPLPTPTPQCRRSKPGFCNCYARALLLSHIRGSLHGSGWF